MNCDICNKYHSMSGGPDGPIYPRCELGIDVTDDNNFDEEGNCLEFKEE